MRCLVDGEDFARDSQAAATYADSTARRLRSVQILGRSLAIHMQRVGASQSSR